MSPIDLRVLPDEPSLAAAVGAALISEIVAAQQERGSASIVLTGGGVGTATLAAVAVDPRRDDVDWSRVDVWWGDERYVPSGDPDRNETGARSALLDALPLDPARIHPMPAAGADVEGDALSYADLLRSHAEPGLDVPLFDVLMLGMGPEGHVASLFPDSPAIHSSASVVAVRECPKPPPTRISLTLPSIRAARQVWIIASGDSKADAVAWCADPNTDPVTVPAAGARGQDASVLWVDRAAAAHVT